MTRLLGANNEELKELILYITDKSKGDPRFGKTKLAKILFFIDMEYFFKTGKTFTGKDYQKLNNGPAMTCYIPVEKEMIQEQLIDHQDEPDAWPCVLTRTVPKRSPRLGYFSEHDRFIIDGVINSLWNENAKSLSEKSHGFVPAWDYLPDRAKITPTMCIFEKREPTQQELDWGKEIAKRLQSSN